LLLPGPAFFCGGGGGGRRCCPGPLAGGPPPPPLQMRTASPRSGERTYRMPLYPWPALIGAVSMLALALYQFALGHDGRLSWAICGCWILLGLAVLSTQRRA